jgi:hypothetical protein
LGVYGAYRLELAVGPGGANNVAMPLLVRPVIEISGAEIASKYFLASDFLYCINPELCLAIAGPGTAGFVQERKLLVGKRCQGSKADAHSRYQHRFQEVTSSLIGLVHLGG